MRRALRLARPDAAGRPAAAARRSTRCSARTICSAPTGRSAACWRRASSRSLILWGPPGCGKTTIARLLAEAVGLHFVPLSAVFSGVADLRRIFEAARQRRKRRQGHPAVRRRDPPLQPRPAGRLPALCRGRHGHPGRRHHREPVVRAERRAAVALPGAGAAPARRCRAGDRCWRAPRRRSAGRCRSTSRARAGAVRHGRRRRPLPAQPGRAARRSSRRRGRCRRRGWRRCCRSARRSTTRRRKRTTT